MSGCCTSPSTPLFLSRTQDFPPPQLEGIGQILQHFLVDAAELNRRANSLWLHVEETKFKFSTTYDQHEQSILHIINLLFRRRPL